MRVQVTGSQGMLGKAVFQALKEAGYEVYGSTERIQYFNRHSIWGEVVVNCAGIVKQRLGAQPHSEVIRTNSFGPHKVAEACDEVGARLIHISTDCVFQSNGPHNENSIPQPVEPYGISKLAGEVTREPHLTLRTSFVGEGQWGLVADLRRATTYKAGVQALWTGVTVWELAKLIRGLVTRPEVTGLLHVPAPMMSRLTLCESLKKRLDLGVTITPTDEYAADRRLSSLKWEDVWRLTPVRPFSAQLADWKEPRHES